MKTKELKDLFTVKANFGLSSPSVAQYARNIMGDNFKIPEPLESGHYTHKRILVPPSLNQILRF